MCRPEQATTVAEGAGASSGGEDGVGSRAQERKGRTVVVTTAVGTTVAIAGETTLSFLIRGVIFEEIALLDLWALLGTLLIVIILTGLVQTYSR